MGNLSNILYFIETGHIPLDREIIERFSDRYPFFERRLMGTSVNRHGRDEIDKKHCGKLRGLLSIALGINRIVRRNVFLENIEKCYTVNGKPELLDHKIIRMLEIAPIVTLFGVEYVSLRLFYDFEACAYNSVLNRLKQREEDLLKDKRNSIYDKRKLKRYVHDEIFDDLVVQKRE